MEFELVTISAVLICDNNLVPPNMGILHSPYGILDAKIIKSLENSYPDKKFRVKEELPAQTGLREYHLHNNYTIKAASNMMSVEYNVFANQAKNDIYEPLFSKVFTKLKDFLYKEDKSLKYSKMGLNFNFRLECPENDAGTRIKKLINNNISNEFSEADIQLKQALKESYSIPVDKRSRLNLRIMQPDEMTDEILVNYNFHHEFEQEKSSKLITEIIENYGKMHQQTKELNIQLMGHLSK